MNSPQKVTSRYVRNLLIKGKNNEFVTTKLEQLFSMVDQVNIGFYYNIQLMATGNGIYKEAVGVTPEQAVQRCLAKYGVTFR